MTRKKAIKKVFESEAEYFTYGENDLGLELDWQETIKDILNMDEGYWNDGEVIELWPYLINSQTVFAIDDDHAIRKGENND